MLQGTFWVVNGQGAGGIDPGVKIIIGPYIAGANNAYPISNDSGRAFSANGVYSIWALSNSGNYLTCGYFQNESDKSRKNYSASFTVLVSSSPPCSDNWGGWDNDNGQSKIIGCQRRRYYRYRTTQCGRREDGNDGNGGYRDADDGDNSLCPGCTVTRTWYDTTSCSGDGYCGGTKHQKQDVSDPYGKGGCPSADRDVNCPSDHTNSWSGWDNDNGQSKIIGCRRRRYYRYRTNPCGGRQDGNDSNGGYRDADDGDTTLCTPCTFSFNQTGCPSTPCGKTVVSQGNWTMNNTGYCNISVTAPTPPTCQASACAQCIYTSSGSCSTEGVPCGKLGTNTITWTKSPLSNSDCVGTAPPTSIDTYSSYCPAVPCPPCRYGDWAPSTTAATVTGCKTGIQTIVRTATNNGANDCTAPVSSYVPVGLSDTSKCPTCSYSSWSPASTPATISGCKTGIQTIVRKATDGGKGDCTAPISSYVPVGLSDTSKCPTCSYSSWSPASTPATISGCKTGIQTIVRTATDGGKGDCTAPVSSYVPVGISDASKCPPCSYSSWENSIPMSITGCLTGNQTQIRKAIDNGKNDCTLPLLQTIPVASPNSSLCPCSYNNDWVYTPCSISCGGGIQIGQKQLLPGSGIGCPTVIKTPQACNTQKCPPAPVTVNTTTTVNTTDTTTTVNTTDTTTYTNNISTNTTNATTTSGTSNDVNIYLLRDKIPFIVYPNQMLSCTTSSGNCPMQFANNVAFSFAINTNIPNVSSIPQQILNIIIGSTNQSVFSAGMCANSNNLYVQRISATGQNNYITNCKISIDLGLINTFYVICNNLAGSYEIYKNGVSADMQYSQDGNLYTNGKFYITTGSTTTVNGSLSNIALITSNTRTLQGKDMDAIIAYMNK